MTNDIKYKIIVLMGGQGAGKGTHAKNLIAQKNFKYVETGAILRALPKDSPAAKIMSTGRLVPSEMLFEIIEKAIKASGNNDIILDGFPRNVEQAEWFVKKYANPESPYVAQVVYLSLPESVMLKRIANRVKEGGSRADDKNPEVVKKRLAEFNAQTLPAIKLLQHSAGVQFYEVDVSPEDFETNFASVCKALGIADIDRNKINVNIANSSL